MNKFFTTARREWILLFAMVLAFILGWLMAYGNSVFFNVKGVMDQRAEVSNMEFIGGDLALLMSYAKGILRGNSPYVQNNFYPPIVYVAVLPLMVLNERARYLLVSLITIISLFLGMMLSVRLFSKAKTTPVLMLVMFILSMFSYGLQFELERGQLYVITIFVLLLAFLAQQKQRYWWAVLLFALAVQIKLTFIIFLPAMLLGLPNLKKIMIFICRFLVINVGMVLVLGKKVFDEFIKQIIAKSGQPFLWVGNHSLKAYCAKVTISVCDNNEYIYWLLLGWMIVLVAVVLIWRQKKQRQLGYIFAICGLAALVLPIENNDYNLSIIPILLMPLINDCYTSFLLGGKWKYLILLGVELYLFTLTLFSFTTAWPTFPISVNKAPVIYLLMSVTLLGLVWDRVGMTTKD